VTAKFCHSDLKIKKLLQVTFLANDFFHDPIETDQTSRRFLHCGHAKKEFCHE